MDKDFIAQERDDNVMEEFVHMNEVVEGLRGMGSSLAAAVDADETPSGERVEYMVRCFADQLTLRASNVIELLNVG